MSFPTKYKKYQRYQNLVDITQNKKEYIVRWFCQHKKDVLNDQDFKDYVDRFNKGLLVRGNPNLRRSKDK